MAVIILMRFYCIQMLELCDECFSPQKEQNKCNNKLENHYSHTGDHYKYLGVIIQSDIKWYGHILSITCLQSKQAKHMVY